MQVTCFKHRKEVGPNPVLANTLRSPPSEENFSIVLLRNFENMEVAGAVKGESVGGVKPSIGKHRPCAI